MGCLRLVEILFASCITTICGSRTVWLFSEDWSPRRLRLRCSCIPRGSSIRLAGRSGHGAAPCPEMQNPPPIWSSGACWYKTSSRCRRRSFRGKRLRAGGLDEGLWYTADWDFWLKLAVAGSTYYHPRPLSGFRIHPQAQTIQGSSRVRELRTAGDRAGPPLWCRRTGSRWRPAGPTRCPVFHRAEHRSRGLCSWTRIKPIRPFLAVPPPGARGLARFLRDSRIVERALPRYRIGLSSPEQCIRRCTAGPRCVHPSNPSVPDSHS